MGPVPVEFANIKEALAAFASVEETQGGAHIKPLHQHIALRLVIEGGFPPESVTPRPPVVVENTRSGLALAYDLDVATTSELTVLGGMKAKRIDVVVSKPTIGPVVAVSVKGTTKSYRNLVNRMEEAIGDSTNIHVMYPGLVYGFLHLLRANRADDGHDPKNIGVAADGSLSPMIERYLSALSEMVGRKLVRNDFTRYESVGVAVVENGPGHAGEIHASLPPADSPLRIESFFKRLYDVYDLRFPGRATDLKEAERTCWAPGSPLFSHMGAGSPDDLAALLGYSPRLAG